MKYKKLLKEVTLIRMAMVVIFVFVIIAALQLWGPYETEEIAIISIESKWDNEPFVEDGLSDIEQIVQYLVARKQFDLAALISWFQAAQVLQADQRLLDVVSDFIVTELELYKQHVNKKELIKGREI